VEFTIVHEGNDRTNRVSIYEKPNWWQGYDVISPQRMLRLRGRRQIHRGHRRRARRWSARVMLHCSEHSYRMGKTDEWRKVLAFQLQPREGPRLRRQTAQGRASRDEKFPAVWHDQGDELYKNVKWWPNLIPLAEAYGTETKTNHVVIWLNTYHDTRVFVTTLGHQNST